MPLAFHRPDSLDSRVPVAKMPFLLGRSLEDDLVVDALGVGAHHAKLKFVRGEPMITAGDACRIWVNGEEVTLMNLQHGDRVALLPPTSPLHQEFTFRNRLGGAFVAPGASMAHVWCLLPAASDAAQGPGRFGTAQPLGMSRQTQVVIRTDGQQVLIKTQRPLRGNEKGDRFLRRLTALAGAPHKNVVATLDGGLLRRDADIVVPWTAHPWEDGEELKRYIAMAPIAPRKAVPWLLGIARGLAHLHGRGIVHRDVAPGNVVVRPNGDAVVIDLGLARMVDDLPRRSLGVVGTPGYVAPEEVLHGGQAMSPAADVYGLGAVGYALLTGAPPAGGDDVLQTLADSTRLPPAPSALGMDIPPACEGALMQALAADPAARPAMHEMVHALDFARVALGL